MVVFKVSVVLKLGKPGDAKLHQSTGCNLITLYLPSLASASQPAKGLFILLQCLKLDKIITAQLIA